MCIAVFFFCFDIFLVMLQYYCYCFYRFSILIQYRFSDAARCGYSTARRGIPARHRGAAQDGTRARWRYISL